MKIKKIQTMCMYVLCLLLLISCSTNPLLTENIDPGFPHAQDMQNKTNRSSNLMTYRSNLKNFVYPLEDELITEANLKNNELYKRNTKVLAEWITKSLSYRQRTQLSKNCEMLVGQFDEVFPLDEESIACAAWWVEKKNELVFQKSKINSWQDNTPTRLSPNQKEVWTNFQDLSLTEIFPLFYIDSYKRAKWYIETALPLASDCTLINANAALILKLENYLPYPHIYESIEKIYTKMQSCLIPNIEPSEKIHLRMGLLRLFQGNTQLAMQALKKTQLEKNPQENSRSLFWLGTIYKKNAPKETVNPYWQKLIAENPLSFAAIVANQQLGVDPMSMLVPDESIPLQNRGEGGWTKENLEAFIFDILNARKRQDAKIAWANYVTKNMTSINPNIILYWSLTQNKTHNYINSIVLLSRYMRYQKNYLLSQGILELQFPHPYLQEILGVSSQVDPIFVLALMRQESAFDENARSTANARGLMQILPITGKAFKKWLKPQDLYEPETNLEIGNALLERLFKKYDGKSEYVLAAYNAGSLNIDKWLLRVPFENIMLFSDFIPFKETRNYVSIILRNYYWYSRILTESKDILSQKVVLKSLKSRWKSERVQALISSTLSTYSLSEEEKNLLNKIFIFGKEDRLNALSLNFHK